MTLDLAEAEVYAHGSIKWDGCSTISFDKTRHMPIPIEQIVSPSTFVHSNASHVMAKHARSGE